MYLVEETITVTWTEYEKGDVVCPSSPRCPLKSGEYVVTDFYDPRFPSEIFGTVFVEGHRYGVSAEYLALVEKS